MANKYFQFKQFTVHHDRCAMKVTTDACLFGAWAAKEISESNNAVKTCLDIGTGTGLLSLMIAQKNKATIDAIEIDKEAAGQANENISASKWRDQISVINGDLLTWQTDKRYDCIFSNPPFYERSLKSATNAKNLAHHDEGLSLGPLLHFIKTHLTLNGLFFLLLPATRMNETDEILKKEGLCLQKRLLVKQTPKHSPFRIMIKGGMNEAETIDESTMCIKNEKDRYTEDFVAFLKDYYLHL